MPPSITIPCQAARDLALEQIWQNHLAHFMRLKNEPGWPNCLTDAKPRAWLNIQKRTHHAGKLKASRQAQLEAIPGFTWQIVRLQREIPRLPPFRAKPSYQGTEALNWLIGRLNAAPA